MLLDGEWNFSVDPDDRGIEEGWHLGHQYDGKANWPGTIEAHMAKGQPAAVQQTRGGWWNMMMSIN